MQDFPPAAHNPPLTGTVPAYQPISGARKHPLRAPVDGVHMSRRIQSFTQIRHRPLAHGAGRLACVLLYAVCALAYADAPADTPVDAPALAMRPAWPEKIHIGAETVPADHPERYTFILPKRHAYCLVEVPAPLSAGGFPERFAVRSGSNWLRNRLVRSNADTATILIDATSAVGGDIIEIYPVGRADDPPPPSPPPSSDASSPDFWGLRSPQPLVCEFRRTRFPTETDDEDILFSTQTAILRRGNAERAAVADFAQACERAMNAARRRRQGDLLMDIRTMLLVETPGTYLFAVRCPGAAAVLLGRRDEPVARCFRPFPTSLRQGPPPTLPDEWTLGREIELQPGVHLLHIAALIPAESAPAIAVGWLRPGATDIEPLPQGLFLSGQADLPAVRVERRDTPVAVSFRTRLSAPYRFASTNTVFSLLTAVPRIDVWTSAEGDTPPVGEWFVDGRDAGSSSATLLAPLPLGQHDIELRVPYGDQVFATTQTVCAVGVPGQEYRIAAAPNGIPPIVREDDVLRPDLWITGDSVGVDAEFTIRLRDGTPRTVRDTVTPELQWTRLQAPELPVSDAAGLSWTLRHGGIVLDEGSLDLVRPPFRELPATIAGTTLRAADGRRLVFVLPPVRNVPEAAPAQTAKPWKVPRGESQAPTPAPVLWLTDFLLPDGSDLEGARSVRLASLRRDQGEGLSTAASLCGLDAIPEGAAVVVAAGVEDWLGRRTPEQLERSLATLALLLRDARRARVIVCTLPPLDGSAEELRPYAAAALRAAATAGVTAADLFSGFLNAPDPAALVDGIRLTDAGVRRAAEIVRRLLPADAAPTPSPASPPRP